MAARPENIDRDFSPDCPIDSIDGKETVLHRRVVVPSLALSLPLFLPLSPVFRVPFNFMTGRIVPSVRSLDANRPIERASEGRARCFRCRYCIDAAFFIRAG